MSHRLRLAVTTVVTCLVHVSASAQTLSLSQQLTQPSASGLGVQIDVSGTTAVIGANGATVDGKAGQGAAYVYVKSGQTWSLQQRLTANDGAAGHGFGVGVAVSGDTVVVGAESAPGGGAAYVFVRSGTAWTLQQKLAPTIAASLFGQRVALEGDTVLVGSRGAGSGGRAFVFTRSGSAWTPQPALAPPATPVVSNFGADVALSGTTACVTSDLSQTVYVFDRSGSSWSLSQQISEAGNSFGGSCAVLGDTLVVGAYLEQPNARGAVYVYQRSGGVFALQQRLTPASPRNDDRFGVDVDLEPDRLIVGAAAFSQTGRAYAFDRSGATWSERQTIFAGSSFSRDLFGIGVAFAGTDVFVGASDRSVAYVWSAVQTGAPGAPTNFRASANGSVLSASWSAPASGAAPTGYTLVARTTAGAAPIAAVPVGAGSSFAATAPNGTYLLSLTATNGAGTGPESTSVTVTFPGGLVAPPGAPTGLAVGVTGSTATFTWTPPASGGAPAGYVLMAGASPGFVTPIATLPVAVATSYAVPAVPAGTYFVRLTAQNAGGSSGPSNEVTVTVAGPAAPGAPTLNPASVSGQTVSLSWTPGGGGAPTSYVLTALTSGGAVLATIPVSGTSASFAAVPSGSYAVRIVSVNGVGSSPVSNTITLVVP